MNIETRIIELLKELNIDYSSMSLDIEYRNNELFIVKCFNYHKLPSKEEDELCKLIKQLILQNYRFNYEFKSGLFVTMDNKGIKLEFIYPYLSYRKVADVIKLK